VQNEEPAGNRGLFLFVVGQVSNLRADFQSASSEGYTHAAGQLENMWGRIASCADAVWSVKEIAALSLSPISQISLQ
jgi:hypothetical protein